MDLQILQWFDAVFHGQTWLNYIMKYVTYLGSAGAAAIISAIVLLIFKKTRWAGVGVAAALVLDVLIVNIILKPIVHRPRPWTEYEAFKDFYASIGMQPPSDYSFPSGHTASLFAAAVCIVMYYKAKGVPAIIVAAIVAFSRIYLCVHYPTDVLAGLLIGSACGVAGYFISKAIKKFFDNRKNKKGGGEEQPVESPTE